MLVVTGQCSVHLVRMQVQGDATRGAGEGNIQHAEPVFGAPHTTPVQQSTASSFSLTTSLLSDSKCYFQELSTSLESINLIPTVVQLYASRL